MTESIQNNNWFILRGEMKYGPYEYHVLINMIQSGELQDYNYVWAPHLDSWSLIGELPDFSKDRLCRLIASKDDITGIFINRESPRKDLQIPVFAHNEHRFFDGHTISVSESGALLLLNDPLLLPFHKIVIHFCQNDKNEKSFNVEAEIIRKNFTKQRINVKSGLRYAVRFLQVQEHGKVQLQNWTTQSHHETLVQAN